MIRFARQIACLFGHHKRSRGRAWNDGDGFHSWCRGCGKPMFRDAKGWHLDPSPPQAPNQN